MPNAMPGNHAPLPKFCLGKARVPGTDNGGYGAKEAFDWKKGEAEQLARKRAFPPSASQQQDATCRTPPHEPVKPLQKSKKTFNVITW